MTWTPITEAERNMARIVVTWIRTARGSSFGYPEDWLPSDADFGKSALLERLRSGKEPLEQPPPRGFSCPWYAIVEDPGPHYVGDDVWPGEMAGIHLEKTMVVFQHPYAIVEEAPTHFIVKDATRDTSYRFKLWKDENWRHPSGKQVGGWFMQNVALTPNHS